MAASINLTLDIPDAQCARCGHTQPVVLTFGICAVSVDGEPCQRCNGRIWSALLPAVLPPAPPLRKGRRPRV
jgi:hypothetical protein